MEEMKLVEVWPTKEHDPIWINLDFVTEIHPILTDVEGQTIGCTLFFTGKNREPMRVCEAIAFFVDEAD